MIFVSITQAIYYLGSADIMPRTHEVPSSFIGMYTAGEHLECLRVMDKTD